MIGTIYLTILCFTLVQGDCSINEPNCGTSFFNNMIRGYKGQDAVKGEFPWVVSFQIYGNHDHHCTASIINRKWLLTAKHCVPMWDYNQNKGIYEYDATSDSTIVAGATNANKDSQDPGRRIPLKKFYIHPGFDFALIQSEEISFNKYINSICISDSRVGSKVGSELILAGFGKSERGFGFLRKNKGVVTQEDGQIFYLDNRDEKVSQGDSGAGHMLKDEKSGRYNVYGVHNQRSGRGVRVGEMLDWILEIVKREDSNVCYRCPRNWKRYSHACV